MDTAELNNLKLDDYNLLLAENHRLHSELANVRDLLEIASKELASAAGVQVQLIAALKAVQHEVLGTHPHDVASYLPHKIRTQVDAALTAAGA